MTASPAVCSVNVVVPLPLSTPVPMSTPADWSTIDLQRLVVADHRLAGVASRGQHRSRGGDDHCSDHDPAVVLHHSFFLRA
jgi:hypothetical protein